MENKLKALLDHTYQHMDKAMSHLETELLKVRAGKASPSMVEGVMVDYYGSPTPISQVANVNSPDARLIVIQPWDKSVIHAIEKAILAANLGFNPQNDGTLIRVPVPPQTEERRKELVKKAKAEGEHARVSIRNLRREGMDHIKDLIKHGLPEDIGKEGENKIQKMTDEHIARVEKHLETKEKEIMTV